MTEQWLSYLIINTAELSVAYFSRSPACEASFNRIHQVAPINTLSSVWFVAHTRVNTANSISIGSLFLQGSRS